MREMVSVLGPVAWMASASGGIEYAAEVFELWLAAAIRTGSPTVCRARSPMRVMVPSLWLAMNT